MISLAIPNLTGNEKKYLDDCIDTTFVSSVGQYVKKFEEKVAEATGSPAAVATSAGTTAIHAALTAVGVKHNDLVIVPTFTFIASANAVRHCGADPWLMDVSESDWCLDPDLVATELKKHAERRADGQLYHKERDQRIVALMPVYTLGNIPNMDKFRAIADEYKLPLVVDAACAIGATYKGKKLGTLADLSTLSFNGNKTITCGGGGAVVGTDETLLAHVRHLTTTARVGADYDFDEAGFNYRMTNIQAAVGTAQMERLQTFVDRKQYIRKYYEENLVDWAKDKNVTFFPTTEGASCWFSGIVLYNNAKLEEAKKVCFELKNANIEARPFWKPVHLQKPYVNCPKSKVNVAEGLWQRIVTLPCSTGIVDEELKAVVSVVKQCE